MFGKMSQIMVKKTITLSKLLCFQDTSWTVAIGVFCDSVVSQFS